MSTKTEVYNKNRRRTLINLAAGFAVWWGTITLTSIFPDIRELTWLHMSLITLGLIGCVYWLIHLIRMQKVTKELKENPELSMALNDEFYQHIRFKSFTFAFFIMLLLQALLIIVNVFVSLSSASVLNINILAGVVTPIVTFLVLESGQDCEESQA